MKKIISIILLHLFIYANEPPFKVGELLKYSAEWNGVGVGEAELFVAGVEVVNGYETYQITFTTTTKGFAQILFPIKDRIDVWIDKNEFYTHRLKKNINQGNYTEKIDVLFDYVDNRPGDVFETQADPQSLANLGWQTSISIENGIDECFKTLKEEINDK